MNTPSRPNTPGRRNRQPELPEDLVPVGYTAKAHGIRGELTFVLEAESPEVRGKLPGNLLYLRPRQGGAIKSFRVRGLRSHHGALLLALEGVPSRTEAELLRSHTVFLPKSFLPQPDEDEVFLADLPGLRVVACDGPDDEGEEIGVLDAVSVPAGQVLWSIRTPEGKEVLFPAVEDFVLDIDLEQGVARIAPPPGLLELYMEDEEPGK